MRALLRAVAACALCAGLAALPPIGSTTFAGDNATLSGIVTDSAGLSLQPARVTISGDGVGTATIFTDKRGAYRFPGLRPLTTYTLTAESPGRMTVEYEGIWTEPNRSRRIDFRLRRTGEQEVVVLASRGPFTHDELVREFIQRSDVPVRVFDLDDSGDPAETVRRVRAERPDVILGVGLHAARLIRREVKDIPSILTLIGEPRQHDLKAVNICFLGHHPEPRDVLDRVQAMLPDARRIGLLYESKVSSRFAHDIRVEAKSRGLTVALAPSYGLGDIRGRLDDLRDRIDVLVVPFDPLTVKPTAIKRIIRWSLDNRVPLAAPHPSWVRRGALFSYGIPLDLVGREASNLTAWILDEGRQPDDFEIRVPSTHVLAVNRETALALDVTIPPDLAIDVAY